MNRLKALLLTTLILLPASAPRAQAPATRIPREGERACDFLAKSEVESILGASVVTRGEPNVFSCRFIQEGFDGTKNKQLSLNLWYFTSPESDDVNTTRTNIAKQLATPTTVVKDVAGFADAAIWTWTPGWGGRFNAFKGGTIQVEVIIGGIAEDAAMQNAKMLAARALGGTGKTGYAYARAGAGPTLPPVESPAAYDPSWMGQKRVIRGTVSRVELDTTGSPLWMTIFFKESPGATFVVCSPHPDLFRDTVGDLYRLVGQTLEVTGQVQQPYCAGKAGSIKVVESNQWHVQSGAVADATRPAPPARPRKPGHVSLRICNGGNVDLDAFVARQGGVANTHITPRDCAYVYEEDGAPPAYVGFGFADSHGQWGGTRRVDLLPNNFGSDNAPTRVWFLADQNISVKHGTSNVSLPVQLSFRPPVPVCVTSQYPGQGAIRSANSTTCESFDYTLNAVAYPDTREVTFQKKCFECPPSLTSPVQRAGEQQGIQALSRISPLAGGILAGAAAKQEEQELRDSLEGPPEFRRMNWDEMNSALNKVGPSGGRPPEMPRYLVIQATVSRVEVSPPGASEHWVDIYFRESPEQVSNRFETFYGRFNACTSRQDILEDMFGLDFRSVMIGKTLELVGEYQSNYCKGWRGSIRVSLAHQLRSQANAPSSVKPKVPPK